MKKRWIIFMLSLTIVAIIGCLLPEQPGIWKLSDNVSKTNIAWMLTATIFVLMMTPGLSLFYGLVNADKNN